MKEIVITSASRTAIGSLSKSLKNEIFEVSSGKQIRDFLHIDDAVDAIFLSLKEDVVSCYWVCWVS